MPIPEPWHADPGRYDGRMPYRRCGVSGLDLPAVSLGLWQNFGGEDVFETGRAMLRGRSTAASRTSISRTITARPMARPRRISGGCWRPTSPATATSW